MKKYRLCALIIALLAIGLLVNFASVGNEKDVKSWLKEAAEPYQGETIRLVHHPNPYSESLADQIEEFEEITGINVQFDLFGEPVQRQRTRAALAAGTGAYDVVNVVHTDYFEYIQADWIAALNNFMNNPDLTNENLLEKEDFLSGLYNAGVVDDEVYALPQFAATIIMYYRKDVFNQLGIEEPPDTISELKDVVQQISENLNDLPVSAAYASRGAPGQAENMWIWPVFLRGRGGSFLADFPDDMTPVLDSQEAVKAAKDYAFLLNDEHSVPGVNSASYDEVISGFQAGEVAIIIDGAPLAGWIMDPEQSVVATPEKTGFAMVPKGPAGRFPAFAAHGWMIPKDSDNKEASWLFLQWATWSETLKKLAVEGTYSNPTKNSVWESPAFKEEYSYTEEGTFLNIFGRSLEIAPFKYRPAFPAWPRVGETVGSALNEVTSGITDAEEALEEVNREVRNILIEEGYLEE